MVHADPLMVLVHSPFLGPSAWEWVARELDRRGRSAVVAALRGVAEEPYRPWRDVREAVDAVPARGAQTVVLVGHSGAGSLLPAIAESVSRRVAAVVFVDAFLPPPSGTTRINSQPPISRNSIVSIRKPNSKAACRRAAFCAGSSSERKRGESGFGA